MDQRKIGRFIAECRRERKITQEQLAELLGVTNKSISKWETGNCLPDPSKYNLLCEILGISINELFMGERIHLDDEKEANDYLVDLLVRQIYNADGGITYEKFKSYLIGISETTVSLSKFSSKDAAVAYLMNETGLSQEECSNAYDIYVCSNHK